MKAWTAGGLRSATSPPPLPLVQVELFMAAGAIVAERALHAGGSHEAIAAILRRASNQAESVVGTFQTE